MAITYTFPNGTSTFQNLYSPFYFYLNSTNVNKTNFKYIIDLSCTYCKNGTTVLGQSLGRYKVYADPSTSQGYFTPHSIFNNFVDNEDFNPTTTTIRNVCSWVIGTLSFGEEYDTSPLSATTGTTIYPNLTATTILGINSVSDFDNQLNLNIYDAKKMTAGNPTNFLTEWKTAFYKPIYRNCLETLQIIDSGGGDGFKSFKIYTYNFSGGSIGEYSFNNTTIPPIKLEIPAGTKNLDFTAFNLLTSTNTQIISTAVTSYLIEYKNLGNNLSNQIPFQIIDDCPQYTPKTIAWLSRIGSFSYWHFRLKSRDTLKINQDTWIRKNGHLYNANNGDRGEKVLYSNGDRFLEVTTGWLLQHEVEYLKELFTSPSIYLIQNNTPNKIPLILNTKDFEIKKIENETLVNYTISFSFGQKYYRQNG